MSKVARLEVVQVGARRRWSEAEKLRIVAEAEDAPNISAVARRHGLLPSQVFGWRRQARHGQLGAGAGFAAVIVSPGATPIAPRHPAPPPPPGTGRMEIQLGGARVVVDRDVDADALARVLAALSAPTDPR